MTSSIPVVIDTDVGADPDDVDRHADLAETYAGAGAVSRAIEEYERALELHLSPKAFDLLCTLVARRPNVVPKSDLFGQIWPNTFVVDGNLNVLISEIRRAIAERSQIPAQGPFHKTDKQRACRSEPPDTSDRYSSASLLKAWQVLFEWMEKARA